VFKLLKNGHCFVPDDVGIKDILIVNDKIGLIHNEIHPDKLWDVEVIDCCRCLVCPGIIDLHVHITGGEENRAPSAEYRKLC